MDRKKQHYIPRVYLSAFSDPTINGEQVWVFSSRISKVFSQSPRNILIENDIYTLPSSLGGRNLVLEDLLANIEGAYATVFREKINANEPLDADDRVNLVRFVAAMWLRSKERKVWALEANDKLQQLVKKMEKHMSLVEPSEVSKELEASRETLHQNNILNSLPKVTDFIFQMKLGIVTPKNPEAQFLTSDNPCALINPTLIAEFRANHPMSSAGLAQPDVELTLPLSPTKALFAGWNLDREANRAVAVSNQMVEEINRRSISQALEYVVASSKEQLNELMQQFGNRKATDDDDSTFQ